MIIKRSRRREWARLLARAMIIATLAAAIVVFLRIQRIEGINMEPNYKDGDLVIMWRLTNAPFLQLRVRGFDD